jgi:hypothetical protein
MHGAVFPGTAEPPHPANEPPLLDAVTAELASSSLVSASITVLKLLSQATILRVTKERWAQIGITTEFLIVVRTLGEFFRLRYVHGTNFSTAVAALYVGGALIATCSCWAGVTFYFFRRYTLSVWTTLATVPVLLVYKITVVGW